jgi:hypothetical protein
MDKLLLHKQECTPQSEEWASHPVRRRDSPVDVGLAV